MEYEFTTKEEESLLNALESSNVENLNLFSSRTIPTSPCIANTTNQQSPDPFWNHYNTCETKETNLRQLFNKQPSSDVSVEISNNNFPANFDMKKPGLFKAISKQRFSNRLKPTIRHSTKSSSKHRNHSRDILEADFSTKIHKGLKQLSIVVKDIVIERKSATYKEVADIILKRILESEDTSAYSHSKIRKEEQNIKRRVYDALNVLISAGVLLKEGKLVCKNNSSKLMKINQIRAQIVIL
jgi:hypothetical protein